ncbi:hypothetical protein HK105_208827 [Polyrhizophydium stewartii]|nr:hypothetical protein HK105_004366 [Polyrhizophydium stewartii]
MDPDTFRASPAAVVNAPSRELATVLKADSSPAGAANSTGPVDQAKDFLRTTPFSILTAIILIVVGLLFTFRGQSMFRTMLFITGFYVFVLLALGVLSFLESRAIIQMSSNRDLITFLVCFFAGLAGGALFQCLWSLAFGFIGALLGIAVASFLMQFPFTAALHGTPARYIFFAVMGIVGAILVQLFEKPLVVVATATVGSLSFFVGVDFFVKSGFAQGVYNTIVQEYVQSPSSSPQYIMLIGTLVLTLIGVMVQFSWVGRDGHHHKNRAINPFHNSGSKGDQIA